MRIAKQTCKRIHLELEQGERVEDLMEAIARASFETAKPVGISAIHFDAEDRWENVRNKVRKWNPHARPGEPLLIMDYIAGRRCKSQLTQGRKYVRFLPGEDREDETTTMLALAVRYLQEAKNVREAEEKLQESRREGGSLEKAFSLLRRWMQEKKLVMMVAHESLFLRCCSVLIVEERDRTFMFRAGEGTIFIVKPEEFDEVEVEEASSLPTVQFDKYQRGRWQGRLSFFDPGDEPPEKLAYIISMPSRRVQ